MKKCPFCGAGTVMIHEQNDKRCATPEFFVEHIMEKDKPCVLCDTYGRFRSVLYPSKEQAQNAWDNMAVMVSLVSNIQSLMSDNEDNLKDNPAGYDKGYAEGYHDAMLDVLQKIDAFPEDAEYYN